MSKSDELRRALEVALFSEPEYCLGSIPDFKKTSILPLIRREKLDPKTQVEIHVSIRETLKYFPTLTFRGFRTFESESSRRTLFFDFRFNENFTIEYKL